MIISKIFDKKIDRDINGVIKAEQDDNSIYQELDEYVITEELQKDINEFFTAYCKSLDKETDKMGVWISGFFGSGKSHLLKILAYILENREIKGKKALSFFKNKINDEELYNKIKKAANAECDVTLFNIDSKSEADSKRNKNSIVSVFMKVFDEMQGYYGTLGWVADIERKLDKNGEYEAFKEAFEAIAGYTWEESRADVYFERDNIIEALKIATSMSEQSAELLFDNAETSYSLTVEKFANIVNEYCLSRGKNYKVIFCVDEIGQYIGEDTDLMLNLQTVVEDLGVTCRGKAWVIVTSQQDIDAITKGQVKGRDFSKIQGRFDTRLNLSSANTDEVIKKRILEKTEVASDRLKAIYSEKNATLSNILSFSQDTIEMKSYKNTEDFIKVYPFIPYQFNLLQKVFEVIRTHGASGKHLSEGERSMLSAFKEAAEFYKDKEDNILIPFSIFYDTIEDFLDGSIKRTIIQTSKNEKIKKEDVELLKTLFLIKYVEGIKGNVENLTTLMIDDMDINKIQLRENIKLSLERLKSQNLIQQNGSEYMFLTDFEQDINREIKSINVEEREVIEDIGKIIFSEIYEGNKYKFSNYNVFRFTRQIDGIYSGSASGDLTVKIVTPYYDQYDYDDAAYKMMSKGNKTLIVKLLEDSEYLEEEREIIQTDKYLKQKGRSSIETIQRVLDYKQSELQDRKNRVLDQLKESILGAGIFIDGEKYEIKASEAKEKIKKSLEKLVENVYTKMYYITEHSLEEKDIKKILNSKIVEENFLKEGENKLALEEVLEFLEIQNMKKSVVTIKALVDRYLKEPYGWSQLDTEGILSKLFLLGRIKLKYNGEIISKDDSNVINYLTKNNYIDKVIVEFKIKPNEKLIKQTREACKELFSNINLPEEADVLFDEILENINKEIQLINNYLSKYNKAKYPGKSTLLELKDILEELLEINETKVLFESIIENSEDILDIRRDAEPIVGFFENQIDIFDKGIYWINKINKNNLFINDMDIKENIHKLKSITDKPSPYRFIKDIPELVRDIDKQYTDILENKKLEVKSLIENNLETLEKTIEENEKYLSKALREDINKDFSNVLENLNAASELIDINAIITTANELKSNSIKKIYNDIYINKQDSTNEISTTANIKKVKFVSFKEMVNSENILKTEDDIDTLVEDFKNKLKEIIKENYIKIE